MAALAALAGDRAAAQVSGSLPPVIRFTPGDIQTAPGGAACEDQLNDHVNDLNQRGIDGDIVGLGSEAAAQAFPPGASEVAEALAIGAQAAGIVLQQMALDAEIEAQGLPGCEKTFAGTVEVTNGGLVVNGNARFSNSMGIEQSLFVQENIEAFGEVHAGGDVTAQNGLIRLGDTTGLFVSGAQPGIGLGGGALQGAGSGAPALAMTATSIAIGSGSLAAAERALAFGDGAAATGRSSTAAGSGTLVSAERGSAFGAGATAHFDNSTAIGAGAQATAANQVALGTATESMRVPGIGSALSRTRQQGPISVATADIGGNIATDSGYLFDEILKLRQGVAVAIAMENPDLVAQENGAVAFNVGQFDGSFAAALSGAAVVGRGLVRDDRLTVAGGIGVAFNEQRAFGRSTNTNVGARLGVQYSW